MFQVVRVTAVVVVALSGLMTAGRSAQAATFQSVSQLAQSVSVQASQLQSVLRHKQGFQQQLSARDAAVLARQADYLRAMAYTGNLGSMPSELANLNQLYGRMQQRLVPNQFNGHGFGHGNHHPGNSLQVRHLMRDLGNTLQNLNSEITYLQFNRPTYVPYNNGPQFNALPGTQGGLVLGNGRVQFRVAF